MRIAFSRTVIAAGAMLALALTNSASAQTEIRLGHDHAETSTHHQAALRASASPMPARPSGGSM